jgi:hypothetical protein
MKTSSFLSRNANDSACSSWPVSVPMHTSLSRTLRSKGTFLNLPSYSMVFLYYAGAYALRGHADCSCCYDSSHKKCTFL